MPSSFRRVLVTFLLGLFVLSMWCLPTQARWYTRESNNFRVYYNEGYEDLSLKVSAIAEDVKPLVESTVGYTLKRKVDIVLEDSSDDANGMADPVYSNAIVLYTVPPVGSLMFGMSATFEGWLKLLVTHEYTHMVHLEMSGGVYTAARRIFGDYPALTNPLLALGPAVTEGFASYVETQMMTGRGNGSWWDAFLRAAVVAERLPSLDRCLANYSTSDRQVPASEYLLGYSMLAYISEKYGPEAVKKLNSEGSKVGYFGGIKLAAKSATGDDITKIHTEWQEALKKRYSTQISDIKASGVTDSEVLKGTLGRYQLFPKTSPNGRYIAYWAAGGDIASGLRLLDVEKGKTRTLARGGESGFDWTPDGETLVYSSYTYANGGQKLVTDLYAIDVKSGRTTRLTKGVRAMAPSVSRDGSKVAYIALDGHQVTSDVVVAPFQKDGKQYQLGKGTTWLKGTTDNYVDSLAWNPLGDQIAIGRVMSGGYSGIFLLDSQGNIDDIHTVRGNAGNPSFSPQGNLIFQSDATGVSNIYSYNPVSRQLSQLTNVITAAVHPSFDKRGSLVFSEYVHGGYELHATKSYINTTGQSLPDPFTGSHWSRGSELWGVKAQGTGAGEKSIGGTKNKNLSLVSGLLPSYWSPVFESLQSGYRLGIATSTQDPRDRHWYSISAGYDTSNSNLFGSLSYSFMQSPSIGGGPWTSAHVTARKGDVQFDLTTGSTNLRNEAPRKSSSTTLYAGVDLDDIPTTSMGLYGSTSLGLDKIYHIPSYELGVSKVIERTSAPGILFQGSVSETVRRRLGGGVSLEVAGMTGTSPYHITLGPQGGLVAVDGLYLGEGELPWQSSSFGGAAKVALSTNTTVYVINKGMSWLPIFFRDLSVTSFAESGILAKSGSSKTAVSVGVKVNLDLSLLYGQFDVEPSLGCAYVLGDDIQTPGELRLLINF